MEFWKSGVGSETESSKRWERGGGEERIFLQCRRAVIRVDRDGEISQRQQRSSFSSVGTKARVAQRLGTDGMQFYNKVVSAS